MIGVVVQEGREGVDFLTVICHLSFVIVGRKEG